ncbi:hypothetical protein BKA62DRAFT_767003 [Auriculariales sp. MPI-PUGE-AT-0066]|nr:hypothetical protein BKA62DRAFT_767003 [Auriculariales sp. MPI-PUGE-AT-0066]
MPHAVFSSTTNNITAPTSRRHVHHKAAAVHRARHSADFDMNHSSAWDRVAREHAQAILDFGEPTNQVTARRPAGAHFDVLSNAHLQRRVTVSHSNANPHLSGWECVDRSAIAHHRTSMVDSFTNAREHTFAMLTEEALLSHTASSYVHQTSGLDSRFSPLPIAISASSFSEIGSRELNTVGFDIPADYEMVQQPSPLHSWDSNGYQNPGVSLFIHASATQLGPTVTAESAAPFLAVDAHYANPAPVVSAPAPVQHELAAGSPVDACPLEPWEDPNPKPPLCTPEYKKLAGHLSEWAADIVLRVVRGSDLETALGAPALDQFGRRQEYGTAPSLLVDNIRYCLMSTLLQPSVVFMGIYFICKLPVFAESGMYESAAVQRFRRVLFGENYDQCNKNEVELYAPFKMFVNGILLASKTLDDATFSNRVWHDISRVPVADINALELASLELLAYDLTVPAHEWTGWLEVLRKTHMLRAPYPAPIGPARETPHGAVLDVFNDLIKANTSRPHNAVDGPIFLGLEQRIAERLKVLKVWLSAIDDDLDADGPLRDEYHTRHQAGSTKIRSRPQTQAPVDLPPPAEWYPAADPIVSRPQRSAPRNMWQENEIFMQQQQALYAASAVSFIPQGDYSYSLPHHGQYGVAYQQPIQPHQVYYQTCCT